MVARVQSSSEKANKNSKFNPFPDPKRGKGGKGRSVIKRPAMKKSKAWKDVPYTRSSVKSMSSTGSRMDRAKWKRTLSDLLDVSEKALIKMLLADGLLSSWAGKLCPRCGKGKLSTLQGSNPRHRCNRKKCQVYINAHHLHPLFVDGRGASALSLRTQAALLMLKLNNIPHAAIHRLLGINHKAIEDLGARLRNLRMKYVEQKEKEIDFGAGTKWSDVEADETTFDRMNLGNLAPNKEMPVAWEQWCGLVERGQPETLVLQRLKPKMSEVRAPGPGAIRKTEWLPLANKWLLEKKVILHTDAAKSYKCRVAGVLHDNVVHCKKRVKINGKWCWRKPNYVRLVKHKIPGQQRFIKCKAGTQVIDRAWRFLKDRVEVNSKCRVGSAALRAKLRSAQYEYWHGKKDLWVATGILCSREMTKFIQSA
eukprot:Skav214969  [mRNA]  locus=scaffold124:285197:286465:- [translate_table: standard]